MKLKQTFLKYFQRPQVKNRIEYIFFLRLFIYLCFFFRTRNYFKSLTVEQNGDNVIQSSLSSYTHNCIPSSSSSSVAAAADLLFIFIHSRRLRQNRKITEIDFVQRIAAIRILPMDSVSSDFERIVFLNGTEVLTDVETTEVAFLSKLLSIEICGLSLRLLMCPSFCLSVRQSAY